MPIHDDPFQPKGEKRSREDTGRLAEITLHWNSKEKKLYKPRSTIHDYIQFHVLLN